MEGNVQFFFLKKWIRSMQEPFSSMVDLNAFARMNASSIATLSAHVDYIQKSLQKYLRSN